MNRRTAASTEAYLNHRCIDCLTAAHAPARPRCDNCDRKRLGLNPQGQSAVRPQITSR